jgi:hypothetical protein
MREKKEDLKPPGAVPATFSALRHFDAVFLRRQLFVEV